MEGGNIAVGIRGNTLFGRQARRVESPERTLDFLRRSHPLIGTYEVIIGTESDAMRFVYGDAISLEDRTMTKREAIRKIEEYMAQLPDDCDLMQAI